jgi:L-arabinose isomerase
MIQVGENIERRTKVGVFGIGLEAYWDQFEGLRDRLEGYRRSVEERIGRLATVVSPGLVDMAPKAYAAGERFAEERVDLIFCYAATYAASSQVLPAGTLRKVARLLGLEFVEVGRG